MSEYPLGRIPEFDERSRSHPIRTLAPTSTRSFRAWRCPKWLDQGREGACVGFGITHGLIARPIRKNFGRDFARRQIYWEAQKIDPWPGGDYPGANPNYEGTSVLAGLKVAQSLGQISGYRWAFSFDELVNGILEYGPAILGVNWYEGMHNTKNKYIYPTGRLTGGHCVLCNSVNLKARRFNIHNSWGRGWGNKGDAYIKFRDMRKLLDRRGEAAFFIHA